MPGELRLQRGRERSVERRHPWLFSGGIAAVSGNPRPGETVAVLANDGRFLAWAAYSPSSQLRARVWSFDEADIIDDAFIASRVIASAQRRNHLGFDGNAARLAFAEADGLPGVIVDRYESVAVCELTSAGADLWRHVIADALLTVDGIDSVYERADAPVRAKEGLELRSGLLAGSPPPATVEITEGPLRFGVDVLDGHKTGYYLDQRDNRAVVRSLAAGTRMLDVCSYTGGFAVAAAAGDAAAVTAIDSSGPALQAAQANLERNGLEATLVEADAFAELRKRRRETFDLIVLDPPKLAASERDVPKASRAYKDLNLSAFRMLAHGGRLVTFSCSGAISEDLFQKIVFGAALDAGRTGRIVRRLSQAGDHPVALNFPESQYLKGLVVEVE